MSSSQDILSMSADELRALVMQVQATNPATLHAAHRAQAMASPSTPSTSAAGSADMAAGGAIDTTSEDASASRWASKLKKVDGASMMRASKKRKEKKKEAKVKTVMAKWTSTPTKSAKIAKKAARASTAAPKTEKKGSATSSSSSSSATTDRPLKKQKVDNLEVKHKASSRLSSTPFPDVGITNAAQTSSERIDETASKPGDQRSEPSATPKKIAIAAPGENAAAAYKEKASEHKKDNVNVPLISKKLPPCIVGNRSKVTKKQTATPSSSGVTAAGRPFRRVEYNSAKSLKKLSLVSIDDLAKVPYWNTLGKCRIPRKQFAWPKGEEALGYDSALGRVYYASFSLSGRKYNVGDYVSRNDGDLFRIVAAFQATSSYLGAWTVLDTTKKTTTSNKKEKIPRSKKEEILKRGHPYMLICPLFSVSAGGRAPTKKGMPKGNEKEVYLGPDGGYSPHHLDMLPQWLGEPDLKLTKVEVQVQGGSIAGNAKKRFVCRKVGLPGPGTSLAPLNEQHVSLLTSSALDLIRKGHVPNSWDARFEAEQVQFVVKDRPKYFGRGNVPVHYTAESSDDSDGFGEDSVDDSEDDTESDDDDDDTESEEDDVADDNEKGGEEKDSGVLAREQDEPEVESFIISAEAASNTRSPGGSPISLERRSRTSREKYKQNGEQDEPSPTKIKAHKNSPSDTEELHDADELDFIEADQPKSPPVKRVSKPSKSAKPPVGGKRIDFEGAKDDGMFEKSKELPKAVKNLEVEEEEMSC